MSEVLLTQEVGSLAKPNWRVEAIQQKQLTDEHINEAVAWASQFGLDTDEFDFDLRRLQEDFACPQTECTDWALDQIRFHSAQLAIALQARAGLDVIYDGEQDRSEMYQYAIERTS